MAETKTITSRQWLRWLPVLSYLWLVGTLVVGGAMYPGYSHWGQYMSELGANGAPHQLWVNYLGFIPTEVLLLLFLQQVLLHAPGAQVGAQQGYGVRLGIGLLGIYALLLIAASIWTCDFECRPVQGASFSHGLHITLGTFAYLAGLAGVLVLALASRRWPGGFMLMCSGVITVILVFGLLMNLNPQLPAVGAMQRLMESLLYLWFILLGYQLSRMPQRGL